MSKVGTEYPELTQLHGDATRCLLLAMSVERVHSAAVNYDKCGGEDWEERIHRLIENLTECFPAAKKALEDQSPLHENETLVEICIDSEYKRIGRMTRASASSLAFAVGRRTIFEVDALAKMPSDRKVFESWRDEDRPWDFDELMALCEAVTAEVTVTARRIHGAAPKKVKQLPFVGNVNENSPLAHKILSVMIPGQPMRQVDVIRELKEKQFIFSEQAVRSLMPKMEKLTQDRPKGPYKRTM